MQPFICITPVWLETSFSYDCRSKLPFWKFVCACTVDETFLEFHCFEHLLKALMKPDGFHLHLLVPAYHPQYNLSYCVSYLLARLLGSTSSSHCYCNGRIQYYISNKFQNTALFHFRHHFYHEVYRVTSREFQGKFTFDHVICFKWPTVELVALDHNRISHGWKLLMLASYKIALLANTW